jgi:hypothetical protein
MIPELSDKCLKKIDNILSKVEVAGVDAEKKANHVIPYIDSVVTAKIIRAILKDLFPGVIFRVRTDRYAGGSSIRVYFLSTEADVEEVKNSVKWLQRIGFDGMTDSTYYKDPVQVAGWTVDPVSYIFAEAAEPGSWRAKEYNL